uniref:Uncharacterized protein n=1 Tax=Trichuris muris TaxID=70415 RepID=A0A5S6QQK0_TRIMR
MLAFGVLFVLSCLQISFQYSSRDSSSSSEESTTYVLEANGIRATEELKTLIDKYREVGRICTVKCEEVERKFKGKFSDAKTFDWMSAMADSQLALEEYMYCGKTCMKEKAGDIVQKLRVHFANKDDVLMELIDFPSSEEGSYSLDSESSETKADVNKRHYVIA